MNFNSLKFIRNHDDTLKNNNYAPQIYILIKSPFTLPDLMAIECNKII